MWTDSIQFPEWPLFSTGLQRSTTGNSLAYAFPHFIDFPYDSIQFARQLSFKCVGPPLTASDAADVGGVDTELPSNPSVQTPQKRGQLVGK